MWTELNFSDIVYHFLTHYPRSKSLIWLVWNYFRDRRVSWWWSHWIYPQPVELTKTTGTCFHPASLLYIKFSVLEFPRYVVVLSALYGALKRRQLPLVVSLGKTCTSQILANPCQLQRRLANRGLLKYPLIWRLQIFNVISPAHITIDIV